MTREDTFEALREELAARGYRDADASDDTSGFAVSNRVRNGGHDFPEAIEHGTATVLAVMVLDQDVQLIVHRDVPLVDDGTWYAQWPSYQARRVKAVASTP
jgi:hypothetical protein